MNPDLKECCNELSTCSFNADYFDKDVYDPGYYMAPAVLMSILSVMSFVVLIFSLRNVFRIIAVSRQMSIKNVLIMNLLVSFATLALLIYTLDGPIQLVSQSTGITPIVIQIFQVFTVGFFHYTLAYSSYTWVKLICIYKEMWGSNLLTGFIVTLLWLDVGYITIILIVNVVFPLISFDNALNLSYLGLSISTIINGIVFSISCYILAANLKEIYDFDSKKQNKVKILRVFALVIALLVLCRAGNDLFSYIDEEWQPRFKVTSFCKKNPLGGLYVFFYMFFADLLPQILFLEIFSPTIKEKPKSSQIADDDWREYGSGDSPNETLYP